MGPLLRADEAVFLWLNGWVGHFPVLDAIARVMVSDYFITVTMSLLLVAMYFTGAHTTDRNRRQRAVIYAIVAMGFANLVVNAGINPHYFRYRPFVDHDVTLLFYRPTDSSFPSNPATTSFAIAAGMAFGSKRMSRIMYALAAVWSVSRVYAGVCYPLDILAGAGIGMAMAVLVRAWFWSMEPAPSFVLGVFRRLHLA